MLVIRCPCVVLKVNMITGWRQASGCRIARKKVEDSNAAVILIAAIWEGHLDFARVEVNKSDPILLQVRTFVSVPIWSVKTMTLHTLLLQLNQIQLAGFTFSTAEFVNTKCVLTLCSTWKKYDGSSRVIQLA